MPYIHDGSGERLKRGHDRCTQCPCSATYVHGTEGALSKENRRVARALQDGEKRKLEVAAHLQKAQ